MQVLPRFGMLLADWQPLQQPQNPAVLADFAAWRPLLESDAQRDNIFQVQLTKPNIAAPLLPLLHCMTLHMAFPAQSCKSPAGQSVRPLIPVCLASI